MALIIALLGTLAGPASPHSVTAVPCDGGACLTWAMPTLDASGEPTAQWVSRRRKKSRSNRKSATPAPKPATAAVAAPAVVVDVPAPAQPSANPPGSAPADASVAGVGSDVLLQRAQTAFDNLEYDTILPYTRELLGRSEVPINLRLEAHVLSGSVLAILDDPIEAEKPFRLLLRARPEFELPAKTPPKIVAVFRKVQAEERAILEQVEAALHEKLVESVSLSAQLPVSPVGGIPLQLRYKVGDPRGAVSAVDVHYRKDAKLRYSALSLQHNSAGFWLGSLPGEWTESDDGFDLQYYLATTDAKGTVLRSLFSAEQPGVLTVAPGTVADARPFYSSPWFWGATGLGVLAAGMGGWFAYSSATELPAHDVGPYQVR